MKLVWGNSFDTTNNYRAYEKRSSERTSGTNGTTPGSPLFNNDNLGAQKAEQRLREAEDKLLEQYRAQITEIEGSDVDDKTKKIKISIVTEQIKQIEEARAQREQDAMLREIEKQKQEAEKQKKKTENESAPEDDEAAIKAEDIEGMVKLSVSHESLKEFTRTKSMLKSEAKQLEIDIDNDFGVMKYGRVKTGHTTPNDFKHKQLNKLNKGITGLDAAMAAEVRKLADAVSEAVESKATKAVTQPDDEKQEDIPEDLENES